MCVYTHTLYICTIYICIVVETEYLSLDHLVHRLVHNYFLVCMLSCFSLVWLYVILWTVARPAPLSMGILQARILEWFAMPSSRGSSWSRYRTGVFCSFYTAGGFFTTKPLAAAAAAAAGKLLQSCPTLCDPIDGSPTGSAVPGILQARTLEWVAISFSNAWKWKVKVKSLSRVRLCATPWTAAHQAPPSMGFSRQKYWSGVPSPSPSHWGSPQILP